LIEYKLSNGTVISISGVSKISDEQLMHFDIEFIKEIDIQL
jgi:hypothetical protein